MELYCHLLATLELSTMFVLPREPEMSDYPKMAREHTKRWSLFCLQRCMSEYSNAVQFCILRGNYRYVLQSSVRPDAIRTVMMCVGVQSCSQQNDRQHQQKPLVVRQCLLMFVSTLKFRVVCLVSRPRDYPL
jgi:hypothetical protein